MTVAPLQLRCSDLVPGLNAAGEWRTQAPIRRSVMTLRNVIIFVHDLHRFIMDLEDTLDRGDKLRTEQTKLLLAHEIMGPE